MDGLVDEVPDLRTHIASAVPQPVLVLPSVACGMAVRIAAFVYRPMYSLARVSLSAITASPVTDVRSDDEDDGELDSKEKED